MKREENVGGLSEKQGKNSTELFRIDYTALIEDDWYRDSFSLYISHSMSLSFSLSPPFSPPSSLYIYKSNSLLRNTLCVQYYIYTTRMERETSGGKKWNKMRRTNNTSNTRVYKGGKKGQQSDGMLFYRLLLILYIIRN